jgi:hypothetical protein
VVSHLRAGFDISTTPETPVDSELHFEWPDPPYFLSPEVIDTIDSPLPEQGEEDPAPPYFLLPDVMDTIDSPVPERREEDRAPKPPDLWAELGEAHEAVARLEGDRRVARERIEELEQSCATLEERVVAQHRRLLVLERQLEDAGMEPAMEEMPRSSWLDRIFGGLSSTRAPEPGRRARR